MERAPREREDGMSLPCSPFAGLGLGEFAARFRRNEFSARTVTATLLARIEVLQPRLRAFTFLAEIDEVFSRLLPAEWLAFVGRERFLANEDRMDAVAAALRGRGSTSEPTSTCGLLRVSAHWSAS
jgi:hypothetical protein